MHASNTVLSPGHIRIPAERTGTPVWTHRVSIMLMLVLTLTVAIAGGAMMNQSGLPAASSSFARDRAAAELFYAAFDGALAGAGTDPLAALLAPGFLDHDASRGEDQNADAFLAQIGTLGQADGGRLEVVSIKVSGRNLVATLRQTPAKPRAFAGIAIEQQGEHTIVEVVRVAQGRIIDRWTPGVWWLDTTEPADVAWVGTGWAGYAGSLVRTFIPAKAQHDWAATGPGFLMIESGSARTQVTNFAGTAETLPLDAGSGIALVAGEHVSLRSVDGGPVTVLIYAQVRAAGVDFLLSAGVANAQTNGATQSILWTGAMADFDASTVYRLGTLELPAGKDVRLTGTDGSSLLVTSDGGTIELDAQGGMVSMLDEHLRPVEQANLIGLEAGRSLLVRGASAIALHNGSDRAVVVTVIVVQRAEPGGPLIG